MVIVPEAIRGLLFGVNDKLLTQHILGPVTVTKYKLLYVSKPGLGLRVRARG